MTTQFTIDLTRPGTAQRSRWDWFVGAAGPRHLAMVAAGGVALIAVVALGGVLPQYLRSSSENVAVSKLKREVAAATTELSTLQANLRDLGAEARRQVRWSELLPVFSQRVPETLKIDRVALTKGARPPQGQPPVQAPPSDLGLQIDASTRVVPGASPLEEIASFMGALAQDSAIAGRFELKTWEVKSAPGQGAGDGQLRISIGLAEKRS